MTVPAQAQGGRPPPRTQWQASSSSKQVEAQAVAAVSAPSAIAPQRIVRASSTQRGNAMD